MANTSLGFTLPVTGTLSGTWGDTVNNEITSLIDTAIAGTFSYAVDGDYTLTTTVSTASDSRNAIIRLTGTRSAVRTITAPAISKVYIVQNQTTSSLSSLAAPATKFVAPGPTTGVTILSGETAVIAWNGTDFVRISTIGGPAIASSMNTGPLAGFRNKIINGDFRVQQQKGILASSQSNQAYFDRWQVSANPSVTTILSSVSGASYGNAVNAFSFLNAVVSGTNSQSFFQRIEAADAVSLIGQTVTLSFWASATGTSVTCTATAAYAQTTNSFTTGGTFIAAFSPTTIAITSTPTYFTCSVSLASAGANVANGLQINLNFSTSASTSNTVVLGSVQLEIGSTATPFEGRPYTTELALCGSPSYGQVDNAALNFTRGLSPTDIGTGPIAGFRNHLINGGMQVQQRTGNTTVTGTSLATANYATDRWAVALIGGTGITATSSNGVLSGTPSTYGCYITGTWTTGKPYWVQKIEDINCKDLISKPVVVSGYVSFPSGVTDTLTITFTSPTVANNYTSTTQLATVVTSSIVGTGGATFFSVNIGAASMGGANLTNGLAVEISKTTAVTAGTTANYVLSSVQLEIGNVATPLESRGYGAELALCQRYYYRTVGGTNYRFGSGFNQSTSASTFIINLPVSMRTASSALEQSGTAADYAVQNLAVLTAATSVPTFSQGGINTCAVSIGTGATLTAGQGAILLANGATAAYLGFSAEL